jgi:hypothetical protein
LIQIHHDRESAALSGEVVHRGEQGDGRIIEVGARGAEVPVTVSAASGSGAPATAARGAAIIEPGAVDVAASSRSRSACGEPAPEPFAVEDGVCESGMGVTGMGVTAVRLGDDAGVDLRPPTGRWIDSDDARPPSSRLKERVSSM